MYILSADASKNWKYSSLVFLNWLDKRQNFEYLDAYPGVM